MAGWPPSQTIQRASKEEKRALAKGLLIYLAITAGFSAPYLLTWPLAQSWPLPLRILVVAAQLGLVVSAIVWWRRRRRDRPEPL